MDKETFVYVDLDGVPHRWGARWARVRKNKESATFEYDEGWLKHPARFSLGAGAAPWPRTVPHAGRHADVRRHRRLGAGPVGAGADAPYGTAPRGT